MLVLASIVTSGASDFTLTLERSPRQCSEAFARDYLHTCNTLGRHARLSLLPRGPWGRL